jgi:hypothetical protein
MKEIKTYIITLPEAAKRRRFMEAQLALFPFVDPEFVKGIRGADLSSEETLRAVDDEGCRRTIGRTLTPSEVGSTLSHLEVMRRIERENVPLALVLEDDVIISGRLGGIIPDIVAAFQENRPGIVLLTPCKYFRNRGHVINEDFALRQFFFGFYAGGYLMNHAAARAIPPALLPLKAHLDWWRVTRQASGVQIDALVPYCVGISISENTVSYIDRGDRAQDMEAQQGKTALAKCLDLGHRVKQGISERARGIRGQRLVF